MQKRIKALTEDLFSSPANVLLWCSGKDLLGALEPWLQGQGLSDAGRLRTSMRDWVRTHPDETLACLPEWEALVQMTRE